MRAVSVHYLEPEHSVMPEGGPPMQATFDQELTPLPDDEASESRGWGPPRIVAKLVSQHSRYVWCLLRRLGVWPSHLDDATQQVFIVAARRLENVTEGRERAFLCGTAVRVASNYRRAANAHDHRHADTGLDELQSGIPNGEALLEQMQARRMLDIVLDALTEDLRTVFVLSEIEGLTAPEVAAIVDVPIGTASSRLRRAREQFRTHAANLREAFLAGEAF